MDTTLAISLVALLVSVYTLYESRKNNRISEEPVLVGHECESQTTYRYEITNKGKGTAFFEKVEYFMNLRPLEEKSFRDAVRETLTEEEIRAESTITQLGQKGVMAPGETIVLGSISFSAEDAVKFKKMDKAFAVRITYKSAHGDKKIWASNDGLH